ncbi:MAG: PH domain-containing protein [Candidatus Roizmanbacteria bacterium]|nr:PH domain-containing protein [Candidatus Roizmanbacteria bacterium]
MIRTPNQSKKTSSLLTVTHLNIRQSISFLLIRLIVLEIIFAACFIFFLTTVSMTHLSEFFSNGIGRFNMYIFITFILAKILLSFYVVLEWLNEYYELTHTSVYHRRGVFFKREEKVPLSIIWQVELSQGIVGKLLNYGSINLFDQRFNKHISLYLIHNPLRYYRILEDLIPNLEERRETIREHILETDEDNEEHLIFSSDNV